MYKVKLVQVILYASKAQLCMESVVALPFNRVRLSTSNLLPGPYLSEKCISREKCN